jgi:two-component system sensor histidine kinase UhpB
LFAVALDAEMIGSSLDRGDTGAIPAQIRSIKSAVSYMQRQVRELIARLRPTRAAELGLEAAIADLMTFWQERQLGVEFITELGGADSEVPEPLRDVIYRIVQESVANALKHADSKQVVVKVARTQHDVSVSVTNRGIAKPPGSDVPGLGLASMRERVHAAGGELSINRSSQGWTVGARFANAALQRVA